MKDGDIVFTVINLTVTLLCQLNGAEILRYVMNLSWAAVDTAMSTVVYRTILPFDCNRWVTYITTGLSLLYTIVILLTTVNRQFPETYLSC